MLSVLLFKWVMMNHFCSMQAYCSVNQEFAQKTILALKNLKTEDDQGPPLVWVHDYHLMLAANTIRNVS